MTTYQKLLKLYRETLEEMRAIGIKPPRIKSIDVNTRAKHRFGQCEIKTVGKQKTYEITISKNLIENAPDWGIKTVIAHELIHTLPQCASHGKKFQDFARKINKAYPKYHVATTNKPEELGLKTEEEVEEKDFKYKFVCQKCGMEITRMRKSVFTEHPERYRCTKCGGKFKQVY